MSQNIVNVPYYYVDDNLSDVDFSEDKGTHSNFSAQQNGPDSSFDNLTEGAENDWWSPDYDYRKQISIINNVASPLDSGYSVCLTTDTTSPVYGGKMLSNGNDLRIVYLNGSGWTELDRDIIDMDTASTQVWFKIQAEISASGSDNNYYMHYGNPSAINPLADKSNVYDFWDDFDDASLDPAWTFSQIGTASGSYSESGTVVILNATNSGDLWSTSDNLLFLSISRSYDVLVESYTSGWGGSHNTWSKMGGVQLRQSVDANSKNRIMAPVYSATGATNSYRLSTGGSTIEQITATQPGYNRLSKIGGTSRAWYSTNGISWTELGSQISFSGGLSDPVHIGISLAGSSSLSHWVEVDWFKVRKYIDPEPSASLGPEENVGDAGGIEDYVDNNLSDVDFTGDKGTHSNFTAQQYGPDSIYDNLLEDTEEENWLSGWQTRIKIEVDYNDIIDTLNNFPVSLYLSNSSGRNNDDISCIFDELQSDENRKKIAVTTSDGITQCYVEVEEWNDANQQAWLWVKVPNISNTSDTSLYIYYDADHADNTNYVGDPNSTPAENVWESNFKAVLHLNQIPAGQAGEIKDSTSYANHGTTEGSMNSTDLVDAKIGGGLEFDEIDDLIRIPNSTSLSFIKSFGACELWISWVNASDGDSQIVMSSSNRFTVGAPDGFEWASQSTGNHFFYPWGGDGSDYNLGLNPFTNGVWHHLVVTYVYATKEVKIYVDAVNMNFTTENVPTFWTQLANTSDWLWGGNPDRSTRYFDGVFDEIRIHSEARSDAWIKASYESGMDDLLDFGSEESLTYELDLEVQWTNVDYSQANGQLCICGGTMGSENIRVDAWNGTGWETIFTDLLLGWNNASITDWITDSTFTIRFRGGTETGDSTPDTWQIDSALIHVWTEGESYELDLEVQWTNVDYGETNEELCIYGGTMGSENIGVDAWNGAGWDNLLSDLNPGWNNITVTTHLTSSTFTIRFKGGTETNDSNQDSWAIDATLLHVWS